MRAAGQCFGHEINSVAFPGMALPLRSPSDLVVKPMRAQFLNT